MSSLAITVRRPACPSMMPCARAQPSGQAAGPLDPARATARRWGSRRRPFVGSPRCHTSSSARYSCGTTHERGVCHGCAERRRPSCGTRPTQGVRAPHRHDRGRPWRNAGRAREHRCVAYAGIPCVYVRADAAGATDLLLPDRYREALTTLAAAIGDRLTSAAGRHACTEAVRAQTAEIMRLVSALHD